MTFSSKQFIFLSALLFVATSETKITYKFQIKNVTKDHHIRVQISTKVPDQTDRFGKTDTLSEVIAPYTSHFFISEGCLKTIQMTQVQEKDGQWVSVPGGVKGKDDIGDGCKNRNLKIVLKTKKNLITKKKTSYYDIQEN